MYYNDEQLPALLTFSEAMEYLFISKNTLLKLLHDGTIEGFKIGKQWRIKKKY
jgi:DNA binding domain-containing protein